MSALATVLSSRIVPVTVLGPGVNISLDDISTPLIFLTPTQAHNINDAVYIHVACTGILIWDVLNNLRNDLKILTNHKIGLPTLLYFAIRSSLLGYTIGRAVLLTAQIGDCSSLQNALNGLLIVSMACSTVFFYMRVVAVYSRNPYIIGFFGTTSLASIGMIITIFKTFAAEHIGPTNYCLETIKGPFFTATLGVLLLNDCLIYIAIAYRIYRIFLDYEFEADFKRRLVILLFGASLPVGSKIVLLESQLYCLIIFISKATLVVLFAADQDRNGMFIICHLVLVVVLSSRVYRELRDIGVTQRKPTDFQTGALTSAEFGERVTQEQRASRKTAELEDDISSLGGTTTRTASFLDSSPSYMTNDNRSDDFNMHALRSGETSHPSSFSGHEWRSSNMDRV